MSGRGSGKGKGAGGRSGRGFGKSRRSPLRGLNGLEIDSITRLINSLNETGMDQITQIITSVKNRRSQNRDQSNKNPSSPSAETSAQGSGGGGGSGNIPSPTQNHKERVWDREFLRHTRLAMALKDMPRSERGVAKDAMSLLLSASSAIIRLGHGESISAVDRQQVAYSLLNCLPGDGDVLSRKEVSSAIHHATEGVRDDNDHHIAPGLLTEMSQDARTLADAILRLLPAIESAPTTSPPTAEHQQAEGEGGMDERMDDGSNEPPSDSCQNITRNEVQAASSQWGDAGAPGREHPNAEVPCPGTDPPPTGEEAGSTTSQISQISNRTGLGTSQEAESIDSVEGSQMITRTGSKKRKVQEPGKAVTVNQK